MTQAIIHLGTGAFKRTKGGDLFGELTVRAGNVEFPSPGWTDFVIAVLTSWCEAFSRLLAGEPDPIGVCFMDGPYLAELGPIDRDLTHLVLVEDREERTITYEADVDSAVLLRSLVAAVNIALKECRDRGWWSKDADMLVAASDFLVENFQTH